MVTVVLAVVAEKCRWSLSMLSTAVEQSCRYPRWVCATQDLVELLLLESPCIGVPQINFSPTKWDQLSNKGPYSRRDSCHRGQTTSDSQEALSCSKFE